MQTYCTHGRSTQAELRVRVPCRAPASWPNGNINLNAIDFWQQTIGATNWNDLTQLISVPRHAPDMMLHYLMCSVIIPMHKLILLSPLHISTSQNSRTFRWWYSLALDFWWPFCANTVTAPRVTPSSWPPLWCSGRCWWRDSCTWKTARSGEQQQQRKRQSEIIV